MLFVLLQHLLPHHLLSRLVGRAAASRKSWIKGPFIRWFVRRYGVDMREAAQTDPLAYRSFNEFFTRALREDARPIDAAPNSIVSPAD
ncbi:MAG TPA: phosphatidylserine decarboxylase, partial [Hyphomicrobiales bacterium]|nr:phosphatidylserine decarboxylase [Hyphomicrobiales bacterium]